MLLGVDAISRIVPSLFVGAERLFAAFVTYRTVDGIPSGSVATGKPGLDIVVQSGIEDYSPIVDMLMLGSFLSGDEDPFLSMTMLEVGSAQMDAEGQHAQAQVDHQLAQLAIPEGHRFLGVVYAGVTAFDQALTSARRMKERVGGGKIVLVTCNCNLTSKRDKLVPTLQRGEIDHVIVSSYCGGEETMRNILDTLVQSWPAAAV